tara:strand:+ start:34 stop:156 length:123 start_codon:yes stop_codon:yes gene_type:complete
MATDKNMNGRVPHNPNVKGAIGILYRLRNDKYLRINYFLL